MFLGCNMEAILGGVGGHELFAKNSSRKVGVQSLTCPAMTCLAHSH